MLEAELEKHFEVHLSNGHRGAGPGPLPEAYAFTRRSLRKTVSIYLKVRSAPDPAMFGHDHFVDNNGRQSSILVKET